MAREGMADGHALEQYFLGRLTRILEANGKRPAVWNEAIEGGELARSTRVHGWESVKACLDATAKGYRVKACLDCHGGGLPYGGDARPVFLFRHAPVAP